MIRKRAGRVPDHLRPDIFLSVKPRDWFAKALALKGAADCLFLVFQGDYETYEEHVQRDPSVEISHPDDAIFTMLLGFAVENLLKGLFVATTTTPSAIQSLSQLQLPGIRHELRPIATALSDADISFSSDELELLDALEHRILWRGRYPSAMHIDDIIPMDEAGAFKKFILDYPNDYHAVISLYERLARLLSERL